MNAVLGANGYALNPAANFVDYYSNTGTGNYNALVTSIKHTLSHQFSLEAQYTWAKAMDEGSGPYEEDLYPWVSHAGYGRSDYNVANAFKLFGLWQPVIFHGSHEWVEKIAGGWSLSGIFNWHTGFPFNPTYNANLGGGGFVYSSSGYSQLRPAAYTGGAGKSTSNSTFQQATNPNYGGNGTQFFIPPTFVPGAQFPATAPAPLPGIKRNSLNGPGYNDLDGSLSKGFGLPSNKITGENARFEIRADAYNFFNKLNINGQSIDTNLGTVNSDGSLNQINGDFGVAGGALGSRTVQLQARFSF